MKRKQRANQTSWIALWGVAVISAFLVAGIAQGAGFVSFERGDTMVFWDDMQVTGGVKLSDIILAGDALPSPGTLLVSAKDIFVGGVVGFCQGYTGLLDRCSTLIGNLGGGVGVRTPAITHDELVTIKNNSALPVILSTAPGGAVNVNGSFNNFVGNLVSTSANLGNLSAVQGSVFTDTLYTNSIKESPGTASLQLGGVPGVVIFSEFLNVNDPVSNNKLKFR